MFPFSYSSKDIYVSGRELEMLKTRICVCVFFIIIIILGF